MSITTLGVVSTGIWRSKTKLYIVLGLKNLGGGLIEHVHYIYDNEEMINTIKGASSYVEVTNVYEVDATCLGSWKENGDATFLGK